MKGLKKQRTWIMTVAMAAGAVAYAYFVFLPTQASVTDMRRELQTKQNFVVASEKLFPAIIRARHRLATTNQYADSWRSRSPGAEQLADLFGTITDCVKQAGMTIKRFDPEPVEKMDTICKVPLTLESEGEFSQIFALLAELEGRPESIWVNEMRLEPIGEDSKLLQCTLVLCVFADNREKSD